MASCIADSNMNYRGEKNERSSPMSRHLTESTSRGPSFQQVNELLGSIVPSTVQSFQLVTLDTSVIGAHLMSELTTAIDLMHEARWQRCHRMCGNLLDITWEHLNTGHWKDVAISWRYVYSFLSVLKAVSELALCEKLTMNTRALMDDTPMLENVKTGRAEPGIKHTHIISKVRYKSCVLDSIKTCDMGLLMGSPVLDNILTKLVSKLQHVENKDAQITSIPIENMSANCSSSKGTSVKEEGSTAKKQKVFHVPQIKTENAIKILTSPSLEYFRKNHYSEKIPVVLKGGIDYWPAMSNRRWTPEYIQHVAGCRTVPIEIGSQYTDENWTQSLMSINSFIDTYISNQPSTPNIAAGVGYLAQHQLFDQIPELRRDISIPAYCCVGESDDVDINAWFGPAGTISPLHTDPKHNILAQVVGRKYIRLYADKFTDLVYPHQGILSNTSQVDIEDPDLEKFPRFKEAPYMDCILEPGEMLYIPPKCWHYVRSLSISFSVSFWWE